MLQIFATSPVVSTSLSNDNILCPRCGSGGSLVPAALTARAAANVRGGCAIRNIDAMKEGLDAQRDRSANMKKLPMDLGPSSEGTAPGPSRLLTHRGTPRYRYRPLALPR